jgi:hypothetical protein
MKSRWPEAEPNILKDPHTSWAYANKIIGGRWPEAEPRIAKDPRCAVAYATNVIKGRWPEAEPNILKDSGAAFEYARDVLKQRWPAFEERYINKPEQTEIPSFDVLPDNDEFGNIDNDEYYAGQYMKTFKIK